MENVNPMQLASRSVKQAGKQSPLVGRQHTNMLLMLHVFFAATGLAGLRSFRSALGPPSAPD